MYFVNWQVSKASEHLQGIQMEILIMVICHNEALASVCMSFEACA